jgi:transcriptional regulator with XRE-family HTH domain
MNGLKDLRERHLITQRELAALSGVGIATVSRLETSKVKPSIRTMRALAAALEVSPEYLWNLLFSGQKRLL